MSTKNQLTTIKEQTLTSVQNRIAEIQKGGFKLPKNYSPENALQSAWLMLQDITTRDNKPALEACSNNSVAMSLFKMVQLGLNPAKNQCYFIPYGKDLQLSVSYFGQVMIAKRVGLKDAKANLILKGDKFSYQIEPDGRKTVTHHEQPFENLDNEIIGAYCVITLPDGLQDTEIMTMAEIKASWEQGATKGNSPAHKKFAGEMAKKTVTNRAVKMFVNSSDDTTVLDDGPLMSPVEAHVREQISENANKEEFGFDEAEHVDDEEVSEDENQRLYEQAIAEEESNQNQGKIEGPGF